MTEQRTSAGDTQTTWQQWRNKRRRPTRTTLGWFHARGTGLSNWWSWQILLALVRYPSSTIASDHGSTGSETRQVFHLRRVRTKEGTTCVLWGVIKPLSGSSWSPSTRSWDGKCRLRTPFNTPLQILPGVPTLNLMHAMRIRLGSDVLRSTRQQWHCLRKKAYLYSDRLSLESIRWTIEELC